MADVQAGKPLITLLKPGTGVTPGGNTPITIDGALVSLVSNIANGVPIDVNLIDSSGNPVPNGAISQAGNVFNARIIDVTPISVNTVPQGNIDNWQNIEIDVDDKNGNPITPIITKVGNTINLDIAGQTPLSINATPAGAIDNWDNINIDVDDKNGNPITPTVSIIGNNINLDIAGNTPLQVNGGASIGVIPNWDLADILLRDQFANVVPLVSSSIAGSQVTLNINNNPAPSGVAFQTAQGTQYNTFANYDEGWRMRNAWFDYVPPTSPAKVAALDYTQGANSFYILKQALIVDGVSSTTRFVDVDGGQTWSTTNNKNLVTIDKLTGLMFTRTYISSTKSWSLLLTDADAYSITVDGVVYDDWFMISAAEYMAIFGIYRGSGNWADPFTGINIMSGSFPNGNVHTATTYEPSSTNDIQARADSGGFGGFANGLKSGNLQTVFIRKCRNLIS